MGVRYFVDVDTRSALRYKVDMAITNIRHRATLWAVGNRRSGSGFEDTAPWEYRRLTEDVGRCREADYRFRARLASYSADPDFWEDMAEHAIEEPGLALEYRERARRDRETLERARALDVLERVEKYRPSPEHLAALGETIAAGIMEERLAQETCR